MPIEKLRPTFTFTADRLAALTSVLRAVVPEACVDGKLNWETLRAALTEHLEEEADGEEGGADTAEHFGLFWPGKRAARRLAMTPSTGTLIPQPGLGVHEATTRNLFIEGDNLEVLKLLLKSYAGRVKLIYIDPPYNTGNDFIYPDDYREPLDAYLRRTGQMDEEGQLLTTNTKASGRFHSNWLSMMYPRLLLARQLLREGGAIFVSIDDNEVHHLRQVMNEVFGEENFVANVVWQRRTSPDARMNLAPAHDFVVVFAKDLESFKQVCNLLPLNEERLLAYRNPDNDTRGPWASVDMTGQTGHATSSQFYEITTLSGVKYSPPEGRCWAIAESTFKTLSNEGKIWFGQDGNSRPRIKRYLSEVEGTTVWTWWTNQEVGHNQEATKELKDFFGTGDLFTNPKPTRLLKRILQLATNFDGQELILDFFSGSCTTAHAVLDLNQEDGGNRRFIMVQLPEPIDNPDYPTIADIGRERIRRVIARMEAEAGPPSAPPGQLTLDADLTSPSHPVTLSEVEGSPDLGFKSYRLTRSHFKPWRDYTGEDVAELETLFARFESPLIEGWQPANLLAELLLLQGFPLDSRVVPLEAFAENRVLRVTSEACAHDLIVCLDARLHPATVGALDLRADDVLVCLDSALTDEDKLRLADKGQVRVI